MRAFRSAAATVTAVAAAGLAAGAGVAAAPAEPRWFADGSGVETVAKWGIADSDAVGFQIRCEGDTLTVSPELYALQLPAGELVIRFSVDGDAYDRTASLTYDDTIKAWQARARVTGDDALIAAMRRGSRLTYDFDPPLRAGDAFTVSLSGSAKAIDAVLEEC